MASEPNIKNVIAILASDITKEELFSIRENMFEIIYFLTEENSQILFNEYKELESEYKDIVIDNLMKIYPMSIEIIKKIIEDNPKTMETVIDCYDIGKIITREVRSLINVIKESTKSNPKRLTDLEGRINELETQREALKDSIEAVKNSEKKEVELIKEIESLQSQLDELERMYSKEGLEQIKLELADKKLQKEKMKKDFEDKKNFIIEIEKEMKNMKSKNKEINNSLKEIAKATKKLKDGEEK